MHAAEGPQRVDRAVSSPLSIISLGDVGGDGGVTDRATRGTCSARSGWAEQFLTSSMGELQISLPSRRHASAHVESNHGRDGSFLLPSKRQRPSPSLSGLCGVEPLRDGQAHQFSLCFSAAPAGDGGRGVGWLIVKLPVVQEGRGL